MDKITVYTDGSSLNNGSPDSGCANNCPHEKRERAVREWLEKECD